MNEEQITTHIITLARKWQKVLKIMAFIGALICHGNSALAQLEDGKIYNFVNVANNNSSMAISGFDDVSIATTNPSDYVQLWYAIVNEDETYSLRNMSDGRYLRSSNSTSVRWTMVESIDDNCNSTAFPQATGTPLEHQIPLTATTTCTTVPAREKWCAGAATPRPHTGPYNKKTCWRKRFRTTGRIYPKWSKS